MNLPDGVSEIELVPGYPALQIETPACSAIIAYHGAHLVHWQPSHTAQPVLYTSPPAHLQEGTAIRGGIPLCWPWFNAHPTAPEKHPSHGVARTSPWQLESVLAYRDTIEVIFTLPTNEAIREHVPFEHHVEATFTLGTTLSCNLKTTNNSSSPVPIGGALHNYLTVSNISNIQLVGLQNTPYLDNTTSPNIDTTQIEEKLTIANEIDRIYYGTSNPISLLDPNWKREIIVSKENSLTTTVWNPWIEKAAALSDLPDKAYQNFLCIEPSNARHDARVILPDQTHSLATNLSVYPL